MSEPITISAPEPATDAEWRLFTWLCDPDANPFDYVWLPGTGWIQEEQIQIVPHSEAGGGSQRRKARATAIALSELPTMATSDEAIGVLRMSRRNFYRLVARGTIRVKRPALRGSSRLLIPRAELERYLSTIDR